MKEEYFGRYPPLQKVCFFFNEEVFYSLILREHESSMTAPEKRLLLLESSQQ